LQYFFSKRWVGMAGPEKTEIRTRLNEFLVKQHRAVPAFITKKVIKLVVDIASTDWPHFYPDFFSNLVAILLHFTRKIFETNFLFRIFDKI
jgi:hypothetical protein